MSRSVLVTGASKGIGRAIALKLATDGFCVLVHYHSDKSGAEATLEAIRTAGGSGRLLQFDIADRAGCRAVLEADIELAGQSVARLNRELEDSLQQWMEAGEQYAHHKARAEELEIALELSRAEAEALRQAQVKLSADPRFVHPNYWGAFVLYGDWR